MATYQVLFWQEIPSLVEARDSDGVKKIQLSDKFQALIDEAAMRDGAESTDDYLADWRRGEAVECSDDLEIEARKVAKQLETEFDSKVLANLVNTGGRAG